jgi:hypothetical protein
VTLAIDTTLRPRRPQPAGAGLVDAARLHEQHRTLMRAYQARYVVLPRTPPAGSIVRWLDQRYDPATLADLEADRPTLEQALIGPCVQSARTANRGADFAGYAATLQPLLRAAPETPLIAFLRTTPDREAHYRDFLLQSSADLLAEASASAFGVIGAFGAPQSALFRILIDEFGYGAHDRKHCVLYQAIMRDFGLDDAYDAYAPLFDTASLDLHNTIHFLFQNPRNLFLQIGFLLFAETAYQRSTADHYRYLREFHPNADARYFAEHAHIDLHHTRMVIEEVAGPLIADHGAEVGAEIVAGAELTRATFDRAGRHLLAVHRAFAHAVDAGKAVYRAPTDFAGATGVTPGQAARLADPSAWIQVGGLGAARAAAFGGFPVGAHGRRLDERAIP